MSDELLKQLAGEMMSVYVGMGEEVPKLYPFTHKDNINIGITERVIITIRREHLPEEVPVRWDMAVAV